MTKPRNSQCGFVLPSPSAVMVGVIIALSLSNVVLFKIHRSTVNEFATFRADVLAQQQALAAEAAREKEESDRITRESNAGWAAAVDYWRSRGGVTVRVPTRGGPAAVRPVPAATEGVDAPPAQQGPGTVIDVAECQDRLNSAVQDAAQLMWLQDWTEKQHEVKP